MMFLGKFFAVLVAATGALGLPSFSQCETQVLHPPDGVTETKRFGYAVSASENVVVVSSPTGISPGVVYVMDRFSGALLQRLSPSDGKPFDSFGHSILIHGGSCFIGAPGAVVQGVTSGCVYVYDATDWTSRGKLTPPDPSPSQTFGWALAADDQVATIGSWYDDDNGPGSGSVYVFDRSTLTLQQKITDASLGAEARLGSSVAVLSGVLFAGASYHGASQATQGRVLALDSATGAKIGTLYAPDGHAGDLFGSSTCAQGSHVYIGAPDHIHPNHKPGGVYLYDSASLQYLSELGSSSEYFLGVSIFASQEAVAIGGEGVSFVATNDLSRIKYAFKPPYTYPDDSGYGRSVHLTAGLLHVGSRQYSGAVGAVHQYSLPTVLGRTYCSPSNLNSSGGSSTISAFGPSSAACAGIRLSGLGLPVHVPGYPMTSRIKDFVPFAGGSQGNLCLGGTIGRFSGSVQDSGSGGTFSIRLDLAQVPPFGSAVQSGDTLNFQFWFRDVNPLPTSNFTDAVSITFE